jgi:hypothetical protein
MSKRRMADVNPGDLRRSLEKAAVDCANRQKAKGLPDMPCADGAVLFFKRGHLMYENTFQNEGQINKVIARAGADCKRFERKGKKWRWACVNGVTSMGLRAVALLYGRAKGY